MAKRNWIDHDCDGHEQVVRRRGVATLPLELLGNAWDTEAKNVSIRLTPEPGRSLVLVECEDDDPKGFDDLSDAYTLYRRSLRMEYSNKRGRFGIGEKEVLVLCTKAEIRSTKGTVVFAEDGTRHRSRLKRERGTMFSGVMKMTRAEYNEALQIIGKVIPPKGVNTTLNGHALGDYGKFIGTFTDTLPTELAREDGSLGKTTRKTEVKVYEVPPGSTPHLYEMGIPVCEIPEDKWHIDIQQKVPVPRDRDSVSPSFLTKLRVAIVNNFHEELDEEDAAEAWVSEAIESDDIEKEAFDEVFEARFGEDTVIADPSDREAERRGAAAGYNVVHGGSGGKGFWGNVHRFETTKPAGKVFATAHPEFSENGRDTRVPKDKWTDGMKAVVKYLIYVSNKLLAPEMKRKEEDVQITIVCDNHNRFRAWYGCSTYTLNLQVLGHRFFDQFPDNLDEINDLTIHELGHEFSSNHLSEDYYNGLTLLGARLARLVIEEPRRFSKYRRKSVAEAAV